MILTWYNSNKTLPKELATDMSIKKKAFKMKVQGSMLVPDHAATTYLPIPTICTSLLLLVAITTKPWECYGGCSAVLADTMPMMIPAVQSATLLPPLEVLGQEASPWAARQGSCRVAGRSPESNLMVGF